MAPFRLSIPLLEPRHATDAQQRALAKAKARFGVVPNVFRALSHVPGMAEAYLDGLDRLTRESGFTAAELDVIFLTISYENACAYCMAAHSFSADTTSGLAPEVTEALRTGQRVTDPRLEALSALSRAVLLERGRPDDGVVNRFLQVGFTERQVLEVVYAVGLKTMANYTNHLFDTPIEPVMKAREWSAFKLGLKVVNFFRRPPGVRSAAVLERHQRPLGAQLVLIDELGNVRLEVLLGVALGEVDLHGGRR